MNSTPKILIIYTGGTIGMVKSETGSFVPFSAEAMLSYVPQLNNIGAAITVDSFDEPMDSAFMGPGEWLDLTQRISNKYNEFDGFVILHGTDTMAYTASALGFLLQGLDKPVIITGAQIPIAEPGTDGIDNLLNSVKIAQEGLIEEVAVCFNKFLLRGVSSTKISTTDFNAFEAPNQEPLAQINQEIKYNTQIKKFDKSTESFLTKLDANIAYISLIPGNDHRFVINGLQGSKVDGVVLSIFGSGTIPIKKGDVFYQALSRLNVPIFVISECGKGGVEIGKYEAGSILNELGAISGGALTKEAAVTKLMVAVSNFSTTESVELYLTKNQSGE